MQHPDEKTLSLYAMGADLPGNGCAVIEDHLRSCAGCREQVEELQSINVHVAGRTTEPSAASPYSIEAIERVARATRRMRFSPARRSPRQMVTRAQRAVGFVRRHPVASGAGTMLLGIALFSLAMQVNVYRLRGQQPAHLHMNSIATAISVFNAEGKELWQIPISPKYLDSVSDHRYAESLSRVADLDGDGAMEVITGAPVEEGPTYRGALLRIYSSDGGLLHEVSLGSRLRYLGSDYRNSFFINGVEIWERDGQKNILVCFNNDRSPSCLARLSSVGEIIGEYWHFGWINDPQAVRIPDIDHDVFMLAGGNDSRYLEGIVTPAFAVIDPDSIIGRRESALSYGFGFPRSTAEVLYMQADAPPDSVLKISMPRCYNFEPPLRRREDGSTTILATGVKDLTNYGLMYTFDSQFAIGEVWASDAARTILAKDLLKDGSAEGLKAFFACMKSRVRYWDGRNWQVSPVRIRQTKPPA